MNPLRSLGIIAPAFFALSASTGAQTVTSQVAVGGGSATDERGVHSTAVTVSPTMMIAAGTSASLALGASGTRYDDDAWQLGGGAAFAARAPIASGFAFTANADANAVRTSFDATLATAGVLPALEWSYRAFTLFGGAHLASGSTSTSAPQAQLLLPGQTALVSTSRSMTGSVYGGQLHVAGADGATFVLAYREEPSRVGGMSVTDRTAAASFASGAISLAASAGHRAAPDENVDFATGSASLAMSPVVSLDVSGGRYPSSRLTGAAGGAFVTAGVTLHFGGARIAASPAPSGAAPLARGMTRLAIRASAASRVELAGDWNEWALLAATRARNGVWYVDVSLPPGEYRYAFRVDGTEWRVPDGAVATSDGFGGKSAYVTVRPVEATQGKLTQEEK
jgi:hypothetical protein